MMSFKRLLMITMGLLWAIAACNTGKMEESPESDIPLKRADFQTIINGKKTDLFILKNKKGMKVAITNYGGRIVSWMAPDSKGHYADIVLGFDSIDDYLNTTNEIYYGAIIGRYANRIDNAEFELNGKTYQLNKNNGQNQLHGGPGGFHNVVWNAKQISDNELVLQYYSEDEEEHNPGGLNVQVEYILNQDNSLKIDYTAVSHKTTVVNLTNHAFFNMGGSASGTINDQVLTLNADHFTPIDSTLIPTGEIKSVKGTPFDFTSPTPIGKRLNEKNQQFTFAHGYDHNFVLNKKHNGKLTFAAKVEDPESGRIFKIFTTEPGIQFYGGNFFNGEDVGKKGKPYKYRTSFALEPQHFPDSPNHTNFPSTVLKPKQIYNSVSVYELTAK